MTGEGKGGLTIHKFLIINVLYLLREVFCIILMVPDVRTDSRETAVVAVTLYTVELWYHLIPVKFYQAEPNLLSIAEVWLPVGKMTRSTSIVLTCSTDTFYLLPSISK